MTTITDLQNELDTLSDPLDLPGTMTIRERTAYEVRRRVLEARLALAREAQSVLASIQSSTDDQAWLDQMNVWREQLCAELLALGPRDKRQQNLRLSIITLDRGLPANTGYELSTLRLGTLMRESGYVASAPADEYQVAQLPWYGCIKDVERRIAKAEKQRAAAEAALAEALLDDDERERRAAQQAARAAAANAAPTRKTRGDGSQYDKYPDGHIVEVSPVAVESDLKNPIDGAMSHEEIMASARGDMTS